MTITRDHIVATLGEYLGRHPGERAGMADFLAILDTDGDLCSRANLPGHVTCSAAVINPGGQVLLIRHNVLGRWLLPGGHLDSGDASPLTGALRELKEETGISWQPPGDASGDLVPFDIDVHAIPASPAKGEPDHWHADFRFAFRVRETQIRLQLDEVNDYAWRDPADLPTTRLVAKLSRFAA